MFRAQRGTVLEVPFSEKDSVKALGAWWDPEIRKWFVPEGLDPAPFAQWVPKRVKNLEGGSAAGVGKISGVDQ